MEPRNFLGPCSLLMELVGLKASHLLWRMGTLTSGMLLSSCGSVLLFLSTESSGMCQGVAAAPAATVLAWPWPFFLYQHQESAVMPWRPAKRSAHLAAHQVVSKSFPCAIHREIPSTGSEGDKTKKQMTVCVLTVKFLLFGIFVAYRFKL